MFNSVETIFMNTVRNLEPKLIWNHFEALNKIPRPSKKEEQVIEFMRQFGESLGLDTTVDRVGNVIIKKPATEGLTDRKTVILQSHLDMVHQKNADTIFDFNKEGIKSYVEGDWVRAEGTTLGADNGLGVATIMTLLSSDNIPHPPLEGLFTIDEETGMTGAKGLDPTLLEGSILLNLDSEDDDELTIGCAGGVNTSVTRKYITCDQDDGSVCYEISIKGLKGGHSGVDIHLGRANSNKLLVRILYSLRNIDMKIGEFNGGSLRNAIPREATCIINIQKNDLPKIENRVNELFEEIKSEYNSLEPGLNITISPIEFAGQVMDEIDQRLIIQSLYAMPNGVFRMSPDIEGLVETSSNLAKVEIAKGQFSLTSLQRSSLESGKVDITNAIRSTFELIGAEVSHDSDYPGWAPNPESPILKVVEDTYTELFGEKPKVAAIHAGVECGIIGERYPGLDMVSMGPTIQHPHSPDEQVSISSVNKFWKLLQTVLLRIPLAES